MPPHQALHFHSLLMYAKQRLVKIVRAALQVIGLGQPTHIKTIFCPRRIKF
jgi:hypothetical protein